MHVSLTFNNDARCGRHLLVVGRVGGHARVLPSILLHGVSDNDGAGPVDTRGRCQGSAVEFPGDDGRGDAARNALHLKAIVESHLLVPRLLGQAWGHWKHGMVHTTAILQCNTIQQHYTTI